MDRKTFVEEFNKASDQLNKRKMRSVMQRLNTSDGVYLVVVEELAELQHEITKMARHRGSFIGLIEEMADVCLTMERLKRKIGISTGDLYKAMNVKIDRVQKVLDEKGEYL